jgi:transcriptional regulator with XRE-family HTH domain
MSDPEQGGERRPLGRPSEYDPAHCERVIELGKEGKSRAEIASALDCSRVTLAAWEKANPEFLYALQRAKDEELAWWEGEARLGLNKGSAFNAAIWKQSVSGRFPNEPYRERHELAGSNGGPIQYANLSEEEIDARLAAIVQQHGLGEASAGGAAADVAAAGGEGEAGGPAAS